jgi:[acyl-carrier-protein] S-malonyltransferase
MSFALLFSGQGTQHTAMLPWLAEDALVRKTRDALGVPDWRVALQDAEWSVRNRNVQILLTGLALAAWKQLAPLLPAPAAIAGYSVGELAAFSAAGVYDADTAIALAGQRADLMDACIAQAQGGLLSVSGLPAADIERLVAEATCFVAIRLDPQSLIAGGEEDALNGLQATALSRGATCTRLKVKVPSHTPLMQPAADAFAKVLAATTLRAPGGVLFANALPRVDNAVQAAQALSSQIAQTVEWDACLQSLEARRVSCLLEIGPGAALAAMWNRRHPETPARSIDEFRSAASIVSWVQRQGTASI